MGKFEGIREYHDGIAVSEYMNMLPMGDTCLDRVGDRIKYPNASPSALHYKYRASFKDSSDNIYMVIGPYVYLLRPTVDGYTTPSPMLYWSDADQTYHILSIDTGHPVTFCESSIKPTVVYMCDGQYVYMWNTTENRTGLNSRNCFIVNGLMLPGMSVPGEVNGTPRFDAQPNVIDYFQNQDGNAFDIDEDGISKAASICWFDNKLVMRSRDKNTVWISRTDPAYFFRNPSVIPSAPIDNFPLWNSWYSSTNSADKLVDVASFRGQLYLINTHSVEIWGRTGNEDSPIQSNTTQVIHYGGRCPLIIQDRLFIVCRDASGHEGVGMFTDHFEKISNAEIERRLGHPIDLQLISQRHENYLYVRTKEGSGFLFREGRWSSWKSPADEENPVVCTIYGELAASLNGDILEFDEASRLTNSGRRLQRYIRDGFEQFGRRVIFRRVECTMDAGRYSDDYVPPPDGEKPHDMEVYIALSVNRGLSFGQPLYRKFGKAGQNNKVIEWRNLGSGNSVLLEVGTTSPAKLQIYSLRIDAQ